MFQRTIFGHQIIQETNFVHTMNHQQYLINICACFFIYHFSKCIIIQKKDYDTMLYLDSHVLYNLYRELYIFVNKIIQETGILYHESLSTISYQHLHLHVIYI